MQYSAGSLNVQLPSRPIDRVVTPLQHFLHIEAAGGFVLLICTVIALALANSAVSGQFLAFWETKVGFSFGATQFQHSIRHWINDGLVAIFFFAIGMEVKREIVLGELRTFRSAVLPVAAGIGGMIVPALLYLSLQMGEVGERGWGIPMCTDIAFLVGCLAVLGRRVPHNFRILLLTAAISDDIGAILVVAVGYTDHVHIAYLGWAALGVGVIALLLRLGVYSLTVYLLLGLGVWFAVHESGVHATAAGVILGMMVPSRAWVDGGLLGRIAEQLRNLVHGSEAWPAHVDRRGVLQSAQLAARETLSPLDRWEPAMHPWVSFVIMPIFALANAGVVIEASQIFDGVAVAVMVGLILGKPIGILSFSWVAVRLGLAVLPEGLTWRTLGAGGVLAGIGFTMSLFIASLALQDSQLDAAKLGILVGSAICAVLGMTLLYRLLPVPPSDTAL